MLKLPTSGVEWSFDEDVWYLGQRGVEWDMGGGGVHCIVLETSDDSTCGISYPTLPVTLV